MSRRRWDINFNKEAVIRQELSTGKSVRGLSMKYDCSEGLIRQIRDKTRKADYLKNPPPKAPPKPVDLCTACKTNPKDPELKYLCRSCFTNHTDK